MDLKAFAERLGVSEASAVRYARMRIAGKKIGMMWDFELHDVARARQWREKHRPGRPKPKTK